MCFGWTEPHYDTFDGAGIDFQGVGMYVMSQLTRTVVSKRCAGLRDFQVLVDQEYRGSVRFASYIRSVTLVLPGVVTIHIGPNRRMTVVSNVCFCLHGIIIVIIVKHLWRPKPRQIELRDATNKIIRGNREWRQARIVI